MSVGKRLAVLNVIGKDDLRPEETMEVLDITEMNRGLFVSVWNLDRRLHVSLVMQKHDRPEVAGIYALRHIGPAWAADELTFESLTGKQRENLILERPMQPA